MLLRYFQHDNIVHLAGSPLPTCYEQFKEIYLVQELMETNLGEVIKHPNLSDAHREYFTLQILSGLQAIHSAHVIHRDLKPSNILVNISSICQLKICDFGLARVLDTTESDSKFLTEEVVTLWYRAPEIMIKPTKYDQAVDLWSVGCILSEMICGKVLFPGFDAPDQLGRILHMNGKLSEEDTAFIPSRLTRKYLHNLTLPNPPTPLNTVCRDCPGSAGDLLQKLLTFNPEKRITVAEALSHSYLEGYYRPDDEPCAKPIPKDAFTFEEGVYGLNQDQLKRLVWEEIKTS